MLWFVALGMASGVMMGLCWPHMSLWPLTWVYLIPWLWGVVRAQKLRQVVVMSLVASTSAGALGFYWLAHMAVSFGGLHPILATLVMLLYALVSELQFLIVGLMLWWWWKKYPHARTHPLMIWMVAALFTVVDFLYPKIFADTQGHILYPWQSLIQISEHVSVYGLTFLIVGANAAVFVCFAPLVIRRERLLPRATWGALFLALVLSCIASSHFWGISRMREINAYIQSWSRHLKVSVIQPNIGDADKLASEQGASRALRYVLETYERMSRQAVTDFHPDLLVWPETAYPYLYTHFQNVHANQTGEARDQWLAELVASLKTPLFFGGYSSDGKRDYNSTFLVTPQYHMAGMYRKHILLAFGEYVPLGPLSSVVAAIFPAIGNFGRGPGPMTIEFQNVKLGPLICYESIVPSYARDTVLLGAELLLNVTNDSWFGNSSEPYSHLYLTAFRSIELRRPLLRGTNTGITSFIDATGRLHRPTKVFSEEIYNVDIALPGVGQSFPATGLYYKFGDWFIWLNAFLLALYFGMNAGARRKFSRDKK